MYCRWRDHGILRGNNGANYEGTRFPSLPTHPSRITSCATERSRIGAGSSRRTISWELAGIRATERDTLALLFDANDPVIDCKGIYRRSLNGRRVCDRVRHSEILMEHGLMGGERCSRSSRFFPIVARDDCPSVQCNSAIGRSKTV